MIDWRQKAVALKGTIKSKDLLKDLDYLTDFSHSGRTEVYNSLHNKFCPKRLHFGWYGIVARTQLAVLHFNSGSECLQATTQENKNQFKLSFSKVIQNWVVKIFSQKTKNILTSWWTRRSNKMIKWNLKIEITNWYLYH